MGMLKNYVLNVLQHCSEEQFGQDAIEWAIESGFVTLSYQLDQDVRNIMSKYDAIIEGYRKATAQENVHSLKAGFPARLGSRRADGAETHVSRKGRKKAA